VENVRVHTILDSGLLRLAKGLNGDTLAAAGGFAVLISAKGLELRAVESNDLVFFGKSIRKHCDWDCTDELVIAQKVAACTAVGTWFNVEDERMM
jgi:hypothetical protein